MCSSTVVVAPYAGAWIETSHGTYDVPAVCIVAPYAGAWIETMGGAKPPTSRTSRPLRGGVD